MLKEREVKVNIYRDESQSNLFRSGGKIRRPKSVQHRLHPSNSSNRLLSVVKVPIKVDPGWQHQPTNTTTTLNTQNNQTQHQIKLQGFDGLETPPQTPEGTPGNPWTLVPKNQEAKPSQLPHAASTEPSAEAFAQDAVSLHNRIRARHGAPALSLDAGLCAFAQRWADHLATRATFEHCPDNPYGENLYAQWSTNVKYVCPADRAVESWYEEGALYNYRCEPASMSVGHFTQLVWKSTRRMGIARAKTADGKRTMIVAHYDPPGNYVGQYVQNVGPPLLHHPMQGQASPCPMAAAGNPSR